MTVEMEASYQNSVPDSNANSNASANNSETQAYTVRLIYFDSFYSILFPLNFNTALIDSGRWQ